MKFSVLLSLYEKENPEFLEEAISSIWYHQSLKPSEIVLVLDGKINERLMKTVSKLQKKIGPVLKVVPLEENVGLAKALNEGLNHCSNEVIARMDTDDIADPDRFKMQIDYLNSNPEIDVLSGFIEEVDLNKNHFSIRSLPLQHDDIISMAKSRDPISHPAVMFKKSKVLLAGGYPPFKKAQDYALWGKMMTLGCRFANLPDILLRMRVDTNKMNKRGFSHFLIEFEVFRFLHSIKFIRLHHFIFLTVSRFVLRIMPAPVKRYLYKNMRK